MNTIKIVNDEIIKKQLDDSITVTSSLNNINLMQIKIKVTKDTKLTIDYTSDKDTKLDFYINVSPNVTCSIYETKHQGNYKLGYKYYLDKNSNLNIYKINDVTTIKELVIFNLNGENAKVNYLLKTISKNYEKYDLMVYHNSSHTISNLINNGVNIQNGNIDFTVSGFVPNGIKECIVDQKNRIINLTNNPCTIKPNLFIDENDVIANHSAHIGKCNDEDMFYLMSRGITYKEAENLIIKGFLLKGLNNYQDEMNTIIQKYWR